ncbi:hypothetical protein CcaCcLH18_10643 [Colletotrichum camelliae]|nr:hypothetical protein CcaCcLH18_10643 [Colletotrichum camelliae]
MLIAEAREASVAERAVVGSGAPSVNRVSGNRPPLRPHPLRLRARVHTPKFDVPCSSVLDFQHRKRTGRERGRINLSSKTAGSHERQRQSSLACKPFVIEPTKRRPDDSLARAGDCSEDPSLGVSCDPRRVAGLVKLGPLNQTNTKYTSSFRGCLVMQRRFSKSPKSPEEWPSQSPFLNPLLSLLILPMKESKSLKCCFRYCAGLHDAAFKAVAGIF